MRKFIVVAVLIIALFLMETAAAGDSTYRLAGIIAPPESEMIAMIETPDGQQFLVRQGDTVGDATVLEISLTGALLDFPDRTEHLQLSSANIALDDIASAGFLASDFQQRIKGSPDLANSRDLPGLVDMEHLSDDARVLAVNGRVVSEPEDGIKILREALAEGRQIRLTVAGDTFVPVIYLGSGDSFDELASE